MRGAKRETLRPVVREDYVTIGT